MRQIGKNVEKHTKNRKNFDTSCEKRLFGYNYST